MHRVFITKLFGCIISVIFFLPLISHAERIDCKAILKHGVFETKEKYDQLATFNLIKNSACSSASKSIEIFTGKGKSKIGVSDDFCTSNYNEARRNEEHIEIIVTASKTIANAWNHCIDSQVYGLRHRLIKTENTLSQFTYYVKFIGSNNDPTTTVKSFQIMGNFVCEDPPVSGAVIGPAGHSASCNRKDNGAVTININTDFGSTDPLSIAPIPRPCTRNELVQAFNNQKSDEGARFADVYDNYTQGAYDMDQDGKLDVINVGYGDVFVHLGDGDCSAITKRIVTELDPEAKQGVHIYYPAAISLKDHNDDGMPDAVFERADGKFIHRGHAGGWFDTIYSRIELKNK